MRECSYLFENEARISSSGEMEVLHGGGEFEQAIDVHVSIFLLRASALEIVVGPCACWRSSLSVGEALAQTCSLTGQCLHGVVVSLVFALRLG